MQENIPLTLLIVEDNLGDFELLSDYLQLSQLPVKTVIHATRMAEVPLIIDAHSIDVVLLDLTLPDSTGVDSVIKLIRLLPKTPIIILSSLSSVKIAVEAISLGAQDYLVKGEFDEKLLSKSIQYSCERKKILENLQISNERYQFVNKATLDTIWEFDFNTGSGQWGDGIINVFGYTQEDLQFDQSHWERYIHPEDFESMRKKLLYCLENKIENWQDEYRFRTASGDYKTVFTRGYILFDQPGQPYRMFGAVTDITARKRLEKELSMHQVNQQKLITELTILAQEKERNELGKELHDNINQMLATVKMYLGMVIAKRNVPEDLIGISYKYVNEAIEGIRKLSKTLVAPSLGDIGLGETLEELVREINLAGGLKVKLVYEISSDQVLDDKKKLMLFRIVQEQINNVRKHANAVWAVISMKTEGDKIYLSVADNGVGFAPEKKSTGIGLRNIASRVQLYSGEIKVISSPGNGCRLEIIIPVN